MVVVEEDEEEKSGGEQRKSVALGSGREKGAVNGDGDGDGILSLVLTLMGLPFPAWPADATPLLRSPSPSD